MCDVLESVITKFIEIQGLGEKCVTSLDTDWLLTPDSWRNSRNSRRVVFVHPVAIAIQTL